MATAGVAPRIMGIGPAPATRKVLALTGLTLAQMDVIELNEAFAAQGLAVLRDLGLPTTTRASTPGAAPLRWATRWAPAARAWPPRRSTSCTPGGRYALCTMCIGVGQGIARRHHRMVCRRRPARVRPHRAFARNLAVRRWC
jgi:acetyl-CoA acyltransferase